MTSRDQSDTKGDHQIALCDGSDTRKRGLLRADRGPIKLVPAAAREVWTKRPSLTPKQAQAVIAEAKARIAARRKR